MSARSDERARGSVADPPRDLLEPEVMTPEQILGDGRAEAERLIEMSCEARGIVLRRTSHQVRSRRWSEMRAWYDVVDVQAKPNFRVWLRFEDGQEGEADLSDIAGRGVFKRWIDNPDEFDQVRSDGREAHASLIPRSGSAVKATAPRRTAPFFLVCLAAAACSAGSGAGEARMAAAPAPPEMAPVVTIWDGVYTAAQADQGEQLSVAHCFACHEARRWAGLVGGWSERPVRELYQFIRTTMPRDNPRSLSREEYAAVVAYILELGGAAAGATSLPSDDDSLGRIQVVRR
jgi:mono/diheme cytochrome c family protein